MSKSTLNISVGDVWWAWQPWFTHDKVHIEEKTSIPGVEGIAHIPIKKHPALILTRGDDQEHGWLVCFFSSNPSSSKQHLTKEPIGDVFNKGKISYLVNTAPQYCPKCFFVARMKDQDGNVLQVQHQIHEYVCKRMTHAMKIRPGHDGGVIFGEILNAWLKNCYETRCRFDAPPDTILDSAYD